MKYLKVIIVSILLISILSVSAFADTALPYNNYTYSEKNGQVVLGPQAYVPSEIIYGHTYGLSEMSEPTDIRVDENNLIYILDGANGRIIILNDDLSYRASFTGFVNNGNEDNFAGANGLYVDDMYIYIADTNNMRIDILEKNTFQMVKVVNAPVSSMLSADFVFKPISVVADVDRLLYIIGSGTYEGIITMDWDSNFAGFIGTNNVTPSLWEIFWLQYSTVEQRSKMVQFVPQDFSSIDIADDGFFFVTTYTKQTNKLVKRLNPGGTDVISALSSVPIAGDPVAVAKGALKGNSSFYDVSCGKDGLYACLDHTRGKVFVYNDDGYLLYTFGAISDQLGGFTGPVALSWLSNDRIAVVDRNRNSVTVFTPTDYTKAIHEGVAAQARLDYDTAFEKWQNVLSLNTGFELAHIQSGKVYINTGKYKQAMEEFRLGNSKTLYSSAKNKDRAEWLRNNITAICVVIVVLVCAGFAYSLIKKIKRKKQAE